MITDINQLDLNKKYTYSDYLTWQFDQMVELIRGRVFKMSPAPSLFHQEVSGNIYFLLKGYFLNDLCKVFHAPFDVRLPVFDENDELLKDTVVQPDICVVCDVSKLDQRGCNGAPDLVVEILSPSTSQKDLTEKYDLYEQCGVQEYWIIHPTEKTLLIFQLIDNKYKLYKRPFAKGDIVHSPLFSEMEINLTTIFDYE